MSCRRTGSFFSLVTGLVFAVGGFARAQDRTTKSVFSFTDLQASSYRGSMTGVNVEQTHLTEDLDLSASLVRLLRTFPDQTTFTEINFQLGGVYRIRPTLYTEFSADHSPNADILPLYSVSVMPHYVIGSGDVGLGFNFRKYKTVQSGFINPSYFHSWSEKWISLAGLYLVRTENYLTSYHGAIIYSPTERQSLRLDIANGKTLEDAGLEAAFDSAAIEYGYRIRRIGLFFNFTDYRSRLRTEKAYGFRLEFR